MSEDMVIVVSAYILLIITNITLFSFNKKVFIISILLTIIYSVLLLYGYYTDGNGGNGLVWGAFLLLLILMQFLFNIVFFISKWFNLIKNTSIKKSLVLIPIIALLLTIIGFYGAFLSDWSCIESILYFVFGIDISILIYYAYKLLRTK